jgi:hypothetical protein
MEFSEVRVAPVQHLWAAPAEIGCLEGYYLTSPRFLIKPIGRALRRGGSWPIGPEESRFGLETVLRLGEPPRKNNPLGSKPRGYSSLKVLGSLLAAPTQHGRTHDTRAEQQSCGQECKPATT